MEFQKVLQKLIQEFEKQKVRYALIGGFALGFYGVARNTFDLDFLINEEDLAKADAILMALGYKLVYRSQNVSHFEHPRRAWGSLDFLHAFRPPSLEALGRPKKLKWPGGPALKLLAPEDLIGFKLQALSNDPSRLLKDQADIEDLARLQGRKLNWEKVLKYYKLFKQQKQGQQLKARYAKVFKPKGAKRT